MRAEPRGEYGGEGCPQGRGLAPEPRMVPVPMDAILCK